MNESSSGSLTEQRKRIIENKLRNYGIDQFTLPDNYQPDENRDDLPSPAEVAQRLLILLSVALAAYNFNESDKIMEWLKKENLWNAVSNKEKEFFRNPDPGEEEKADLSWRFESAYFLAWVLGRVDLLPEPTRECNEQLVRDFLTSIPSIGSPTRDFCTSAQFRSPAEILDETFFYQQVMLYFNDILINQKENTSGILQRTSYERVTALNWVRGFEGKKDWDELARVSEEDSEGS